MIAASPMQPIYDLVAQIAPTSINVLVLGETGVGKDVVAQRIHEVSARAARPFLRINCAALSESLLESELCGHERGAFTGAVQTKRGLLETADGGTVFLDEIGELPLPLQAKLLRVIEDRRVMRVGGLASRAIDVRFIAATNRNLDQEVERRGFRQDLFFRLNGATIKIPPLRERVSEIEGLVHQFASRFARELGRGRIEFTEDAMALLEWYSWPGNIRELRNMIERAVILCRDGLVTAEHLPVAKIRSTEATVTITTPPTLDDELVRLERETTALERRRIEEALDACSGNQTHAARLLGISRGTLIKRLTKHGFGRPRQRPFSAPGIATSGSAAARRAATESPRTRRRPPW